MTLTMAEELPLAACGWSWLFKVVLFQVSANVVETGD